MIDYREVEFKKQKYCVCRYKQNGKNKLFIIDADDFDDMIMRSPTWFNTNGYVSFSSMKNGIKNVHYLHNVVMGKKSGGGKGQKYTYDHITRNTHDNRKINLRLVTQCVQNENQKRRERCADFPECSINIDDIPRCVYYSKPQSGHGEMFVIELKKNGKKKTWKSSSSVKKSLEDKFIEIKEILLQISKVYPELLENKSVIENYSDEAIRLMKQFNHIIESSGYKCAKNNLMEIPEKKIVISGINDASEETKKYLETMDIVKKTGKSHKNTLPEKCGITPDMIPKHCYYQPETEKRGDAFIIDRHPNLPNGKRQWKTSGSKKVSTEDKFNQLMRKLREIDPGRKKYTHNIKLTEKKMDDTKTSKIHKKSVKKKKSAGSKTSKSHK